MLLAFQLAFMKTFFTLLFSMTLFTACNRAEQPVEALPVAQSHSAANVLYGTDSLQRMDVYLPAGRSSVTTPSLILIHGGGWNGGSKAEFAPYLDTLKKRLPGYALFNLDYRLVANGHIFPAQEQDVKAALDQIVAKADQYQINPDKLVLLGFSAGGHLSLLQGYKHKTPQVKAIVDFFGPTDLLAMYNNPWHQLVPYALQMVTGATPQSNPDIYRGSSPVNFITAQSPPTLILHGGNDEVVNISQSRLLKQKLQQAGVPHELIEYPNERHGWYGATLTHSFNRVQQFLERHVH
jgi:acetyl esterase/lipase